LQLLAALERDLQPAERTRHIVTDNPTGEKTPQEVR
jgi:hypothetical protein